MLVHFYDVTLLFGQWIILWGSTGYSLFCVYEL